MGGFTRLSPAREADLMLVGPSVAAVADDPEGAEVFREVVDCWRTLPPAVRRRIQLVNLPMDDLQENAAMVNAIQRQASIIVQKSLREGFGLTVTEAMWKGAPLVASRVGGIQDPVQHGVSGLLLEDPRDLDGFAAALDRLLGDPGWARELGRNAREQVTRRYLAIRSLSDYSQLIDRLDRVAPPTTPR